MARVHICGTGVISAIGLNAASNFNSLKAGQCGIGPLTLFESIHALPVGQVPLSNAQLAEKAGASALLPRTSLLAIAAAREAMQTSGISHFSTLRCGFIAATTVGGMDRTELYFETASTDLSLIQNHSCGHTTNRAAEHLGRWDFISTVNTACSSSVNSIMLGARLIAAGKLDVVVAGGADALTKFTLNGFNSLMILDKNLCRPFDASRNGLNLGEGAGFVVLASDGLIEKLELQSMAVISGYANTNDAYHQTASSPEGRGSFAAMQQALQMGGLSPDAIHYINLHGTGTINNDASEGAAIKRLFADRPPAMSSTKSFTGHTLGASGGIETVFSVMALQHQGVFPNLRFETPIAETGLVPQVQFEQRAIQHVMSNSFGFGGNCSSIIVSKP